MAIRDSIWNGSSFESVEADMLDNKDSSDFLLLSGGTLTGKLTTNSDIEINGSGKNFIAPNNYGYKGTLTAGGSDYLIWMNPSNHVVVGYNNRAIKLDCDNITQRSGHKLYHEGFKPNATDVGAAPTSHNHDGVYLKPSGGTLTGKLLLQNGTGTTGGFSFAGDGASDTGIFSPSDGIMNFYNNAQHIFTTDTTGINISNGKALKHNGTTIIGTDGKVYNAVWNDYAEYFKRDMSQTFEHGDVIISNGDSTYAKSTHKNDQRVIGVYSDSFGQCLGGKGDGNDEENFLSIGLAGRVKVKLVGKINNGDLICASDIPGVAMKSESYVPGSIIGKAVESKTTDAIERVEMFIMNI